MDYPDRVPPRVQQPLPMRAGGESVMIPTEVWCIRTTCAASYCVAIPAGVVPPPWECQTCRSRSLYPYDPSML